VTLFKAVFLGIVQGLTEFLPVSSSGHLVIGQKLLGFKQPPVFFDVLVHLGTLAAVLFFFWSEFKKINLTKIWLVAGGTIPALIVGLLLNNYTETIFNSLTLVGVCLLVTAVLLFSTRKMKKEKLDFSQLKFSQAFIIGCFQALAILPGISRSGSTVVAGLGQGLKRRSAFAFSFYLAVPAMIGALVLQLPQICANSGQLELGLVGMLTAAFSGFLSLKMLEKTVLKGKLFYFAFYCLFLGLIVLLGSRII